MSAAGTSSSPWGGGTVVPGVECVLAPNPGPMTLDGTNTWLLAAPGAGRGIVVDPGPADEGHLRAVADRAAARGLRIVTTLLTHGHPDHADGARRFAQLTGSTVRGLDPGRRSGAGGLVDGELIEVDGLGLEVLATPGHTADSASFLLPGPRVLLTGDTVLGRGTAVVAHPDGRLGDYLTSLGRLRELCVAGAVDRLLPGHGPVPADPVAVLTGYLEHRRVRLDAVRRAVSAGARTPAEVVEVVYADVSPDVRFAAELSVRAQLAYLDPGSG